ncbi:hypothetical protein FO519_001305 [Halicephalobus sp. NKZ332]|nr:hypothetical protein FO519_001305 [Halicephalobus sp. NKZ332]
MTVGVEIERKLDDWLISKRLIFVMDSWKVVFLLNAIIYQGASLSNPPLNTFVALNECFEYKKGFKIDLHEDHMIATDSIQFKDDCLKACLKTLVQEGFTCRSLMHMPRDNDCVLTARNTEDGARLEKIDDFGFMSNINYYENKCANGPFEKSSAIAEATFSSYKGILGGIQIAQSEDKTPMILALIDGLRSNSLMDISIRRSPVNDCFKLRHSEIKLSERLLQVFTDNKGFAIQPWTIADKQILGDNFLGSTVLLIDTLTQRIVDCAVMKIKGDPEEYERKKNLSSRKFVNFLLILVSFFVIRIN